MKFQPLLFLPVMLAGVNANKEDSVFLWSSTGGGWRAQFACVGYANVFQQAGLFTPTSSKLVLRRGVGPGFL